MKFSFSKKAIFKAIAVLLFISVAVSAYIMNRPKEDLLWLESDETHSAGEENEREIASLGESNKDDSNKDEMIVVDLAGEIKNPSVYILPSGSRVYEAIEAAGGLTENGDTRNTNLATPLSDGMKLYIPSRNDVEREQTETGEAPGIRYSSGKRSVGVESGSSTDSGLININVADSNELQKLTGVGPATADKIIKYRSEYGGFKKIDELKNVSGIGEKTYIKLKNSITIE